MKLKSAAILLVLFTAFSLPQAWCSNIATHVTTGSHKIKGQNLSGAKQQAVKKALGQAVQRAFAKLVSRDVFASNLEFLYDRLLPSAQDFVVTYRVLDGIQHKGMYLVGVESKVNLDLVERRLKKARIIKTGQTRPMVLMLLAEETPDAPQPLHWWGNGTEPYTSPAETTLKTRLKKDRIPFVRSGEAYPAHTIPFASVYDAKAAMALGRTLKANLVVLGKASAVESANRMGDERAFDADIDLAVYDVKTQTQVSRTTAKATVKSESEYEGAAQALEEASTAAGKDLSKKIISFWNRTLKKEKQFDLTIEGDKFLTRFIALKRRMRDIRDIENMQPKEIGSNHALLEVTFKGTSRQFADTILLKTFEGFGIEIQEVTGDQVKIKFTDPQGQSAGKANTPAVSTPKKN